MRIAYWLAAALLGAHEVDAGFWREWELLRLPGGPGLFVALHVGVFLLILWGYEQVVARRRVAAAVMSHVLGGGCLLALGLHGWFLLHDDQRFRTAVSLVLLASLGVVGASLAALGVRELGARAESSRASDPVAGHPAQAQHGPPRARG
jgi:hypothetical protein